MNKPLPFQEGTFTGEGTWSDRKGGRGRYTSEFRITMEDGAWKQVTRRHFLNDDGSVLYIEDSTVNFIPDPEGFIVVTIENGGNKYSGAGYTFGNCCHYDLDVSSDNHLENTYFIEGDEIRLLGSASNKGNYTIWEERLGSAATNIPQPR